MPELDATTLAKIAELRTITENWSEKPETYQCIKIGWSSGSIYYAARDIEQLSPSVPVSPIEARLPAASDAFFLPIGGESTLGDKEISIEMWDAGFPNWPTNTHEGVGEFADLVETEGEGVPVEVFFWFPAVTLLLSIWTGHLRSDEESDEEYWRGKIANGFRSPNLPMPGRAHYPQCQAIYGKLLDTQEEIDAAGCPHNAHIGGAIGNNLHATCPRLNTQNCIDRGVPPEYHLSHNTTSVTVVNNQTQGGALYSVSRGNETNLKKTVRVIMGRRRARDCEVLNYARHYNNNTPSRGFFEATYEICEGPVQSLTAANFTVPGGDPETQWANPQHYSYRLGYPGQSPLSADRLTPHGYSRTVIARYNFGWVNPGSVNQNNCRAQAIVEGLNDIRVYTDADTYAEQYTTFRAWQIAKMLTSRIWGYGLDYARLDINSFIDCANWNDAATFTTPEGAVYSYSRGESNVELNERTTQQQIEDMCLAGRLSRRFLFQGKYHITPVRALTAEELAACPVFTDTGTNRNIIADNTGKSSLKRSKQDDLDLPNRIEATFDDITTDWLEQTAQPVEDQLQQLAAGRKMGDHTIRKVTKKYSFLGVTESAYAQMLMHWLLWFGEFGEGGTKNNRSITFDCFFLDALTLHEYKVIKVESAQLVRHGFEYWQIKKIQYHSNLHVTITAQAFNQAELLAFETAFEVGVDPGEPGELPTDPPIIPGEVPGTPFPPCQLTFGEITYAENQIAIGINPC